MKNAAQKDTGFGRERYRHKPNQATRVQELVGCTAFYAALPDMLKVALCPDKPLVRRCKTNPPLFRGGLLFLWGLAGMSLPG